MKNLCLFAILLVSFFGYGFTEGNTSGEKKIDFYIINDSILISPNFYKNMDPNKITKATSYTFKNEDHMNIGPTFSPNGYIVIKTRDSIPFVSKSTIAKIFHKHPATPFMFNKHNVSHTNFYFATECIQKIILNNKDSVNPIIEITTD